MMPVGIYRQAGLQLHNQIYFELIAFGSQGFKGYFNCRQHKFNSPRFPHQ